MCYALKINTIKKQRESIMKSKKLLAILGICVVMSATSVTAFAATIPSQTETNVDTNKDVQPRVKWTGKARLGTGVYYNVTSSNNIFADSPKVTNHAGNPGKIRVRVINSKGEQVGSTKDIKAGSSVRLDKIPAFSGTYTLQAKALDKSGSYTITID